MYAVLLEYGRQMRPMNLAGNPRSYHGWFVWRPMPYDKHSPQYCNSKNLVFLPWVWAISAGHVCHASWEVMIKTYTIDFYCMKVQIKDKYSEIPILAVLNWFHCFSRLLIDGPPRIEIISELDHPTINHGWSIGRPKVFLFLQHCVSINQPYLAIKQLLLCQHDLPPSPKIHTSKHAGNMDHVPDKYIQIPHHTIEFSIHLASDHKSDIKPRNTLGCQDQYNMAPNSR